MLTAGIFTRISHPSVRSCFNKTSLLKLVVDGGVIKVKALFGVSYFSSAGDKVMILMSNDEGKSTLRF